MRRALVAGFGAVVGREAAADALAWAWQNWERVQEIESPVGYLYSTVECRLPRRAGAGEATLIERLVENRGTR